MKHDYKTYIILSVVFLFSILGSYFIPVKEMLKAVIAAPGVVALLAALFQVMRDQVSYEKQLEIQKKQFEFTIGAASHMANAAFDKHVEFCEKYMTEINDAIHTLFRDGETPIALNHAGALNILREKYAVWLTDEININLRKFEDALRKLGAEAHFIETTAGVERYAKERSMKIDSTSELFHEILGFDKTQDLNEDYAVEKIKKKVKDILGIEELTNLRKYLVKEASKVLGNGT